MIGGLVRQAGGEDVEAGGQEELEFEGVAGIGREEGDMERVVLLRC